jgi:hypothetical protein
MIGQRIESQPAPPIGAVLSLIIALAFLVLAGVLRSPHPAIFSLMPAAVAVTVALTRPKFFAALATPDALEIEFPPQQIPYADIDGLVMRGSRQSRNAPIEIAHSNGVVVVPARLNVSSAELLSFLQSRISPRGSRDVNPALESYLHRQEDAFGTERVFTYRARPYVPTYPHRRAAIVLLAMALAAVIWSAIAGSVGGPSYEPWFVLGIVFAFMFGVFALALWFSDSRPRIKNWERSGLVIGPEGLAMVQGPMCGELRWGELRKVQFRAKPGATSSCFSAESQRPMRGVVLDVGGASILIADLYDRPISMIYDQIIAYWQDRDANA